MKRPAIKLRVYYKIILPFVVVIILGMATTLPYGINITNQLNLQRADQELATVSQVMVNYIGVRLDELLSYTQAKIQNESVRTAISGRDEETLFKILLPFKSRLKIDFMAAYNREGVRIAGLGDPAILQIMDRLDAVPKSLMGMNIKSLYVSGGAFFLIAGVPNETAKKGMDGALAAGFQVDRNFMSGLAALIGHPVALVSEDRRVIMASDESFGRVLREGGEAVRGRVTRFFDFEMRDEPYRALAGKPVLYNLPAVTIAVATPMREIFAFRNRILQYMLFMSLLGIITVVIMGIILARAINNPIRRLLALTEEVGRGNLEVQAEEIPGDELGNLTLSFNRMVSGLRENMAEIQASRAKMARYTLELERHSLQLQKDKNEIEAILKSMRDGLIMVDRQGTVLAINPEASRIIGCDQNLCLGHNIQKSLNSFLEVVAEPIPLMRALEINDSDASWDINMEINILAPHKIFYRLKSYPVLEETGALLGWILIWTNITREKEIEEMKNNFLATISHELRTPLTSIKGSLSLLLDGNLGILSQDQREFIKIANQNSDRLTGLVNNLLDLARMEAGDIRSRKAACDLIQLVQKSISNMKAQAVNRHSKIDFEATVAAAPITADFDRIIQLVTNLVDNAIKFSPEWSPITIHLREMTAEPGEAPNGPLAELPAGVYYLVQITDRGRGIPPEHIEKIFEKFHQADMSSTRPVGGSGLGLAIARTIVRDHDGAIWAENLPEGGSRFSFVIPKAKAEQKISLPK